MDDINLREVANAIIKEFPQLADDIDDAYKTMNKCIKDGESKIEEETPRFPVSTHLRLQLMRRNSEVNTRDHERSLAIGFGSDCLLEVFGTRKDEGVGLRL